MLSAWHDLLFKGSFAVRCSQLLGKYVQPTISQALTPSKKVTLNWFQGLFIARYNKGFSNLIIRFSLITKEMLNHRTRIKRAFTSLRTLLALFSLTYRWTYQVIRHAEPKHAFAINKSHKNPLRQNFLTQLYYFSKYKNPPFY